MVFFDKYSVLPEKKKFGKYFHLYWVGEIRAQIANHHCRKCRAKIHPIFLKMEISSTFLLSASDPSQTVIFIWNSPVNLGDWRGVIN